MKHWLALIAAALLLAAAGPVVEQPLADSVQEARAQNLFKQIRCVVCAGQSIADSPADVAENVRISVRELVASGQSDETILSVLTERYGEAVLMSPRWSPRTWLLWMGPGALLLIAVSIVAAYAGARRIDRP